MPRGSSSVSHRPACANGRTPRTASSVRRAWSSVDRLDVGARDHDVLDADFAQPQDVVQHRPLVGRERRHRRRRRSAARRPGPRAGAPVHCGLRTVRKRAPEARAGRLSAGSLLRRTRYCRCRRRVAVLGVGYLCRRGPAGVECSFIVSSGIQDRVGVPHRDQKGQASARMRVSSRFHLLGLVVLDVVVAEKMQKAVNDQMREMVVDSACPVRAASRATVSRASTISPSIGPACRPGRAERPERTARWSACPCRATRR